MLIYNLDILKKLRYLTGAGVLDCKNALIKSNWDIQRAIYNMRKLGQFKALSKINKKVIQGIILAKVSENFKYGVIIELNCESDFVAKNLVFLNFGKKILNILLNKFQDYYFCSLIDLNLKFEKERLSLIYKFGENIVINKIFFLKGFNLDFYIHNFRIGALVSFNSHNTYLTKMMAMQIVAQSPKYIEYNNIPSDILNYEYKIQLNFILNSFKCLKFFKLILNNRMNNFVNEIILLNQIFIKDSTKTVKQILNEFSIQVNDFVRFELGK